MVWLPGGEKSFMIHLATSAQYWRVMNRRTSGVKLVALSQSHWQSLLKVSIRYLLPV